MDFFHVLPAKNRKQKILRENGFLSSFGADGIIAPLSIFRYIGTILRRLNKKMRAKNARILKFPRHSGEG